MSQLRLLLSLYLRPRAALAGILDEGRLLFAGLAVVVVSLLAGAGWAAWLLTGQAARVPAVSPRAVVPASPAAVPEANGPEAAADDGSGQPVPLPTRPPFPWLLPGLLSGSGLFSVVALALLYAPAALLLVTLLEPVGSFGVAFRRDFGSLLACTWMTWAAARLPYALAGLAITPFLEGWTRALVATALWAAGGLHFAALMFVAVRVIFGARPLSALVVVAIAPLALLLQPFMFFLASPFMLYLAWRFFQGDIGDVTRAFGHRQSFKRYLQAATLNPRDAEAHYQLGLIHQQRQQWDEASERFRKAVEIDPRELDAHYQLGRIARRQGRQAEAIQHFEEVVARDEAFARHEIWREVGATYLESDSLEHARWALSRYAEHRTHDPEGLYMLGEASRRLGETEAAAQRFRQCLEAVETTPAFRRREVARWRKLAQEGLSRLPAGGS
jgi:tetratricopeptide (TPR) repeat protein